MGAQWYDACNGTELWLVTDDGRLLTTSIPWDVPGRNARRNREVKVEIGSGGMMLTAYNALWRMPADTPWRYWANGQAKALERVFPL